MDVLKVRAALKRMGEPDYRLRQIVGGVYQENVASYDDIKVLPKALRAELKKRAPILCIETKRVAVSGDRRAHKALMGLHDGKLIESVLLRPKPDGPWSVCVSSQVGCAMGCVFCATGTMGLRRDLNPEEIADQVLFWRQYLKMKRLGGRVTNVVYMGMGEPLHNLDNVFSSLRILLDPERFGFADRHVSVSTVGIIPGIARFISAFPQVNLAVSLHAADERTRSRLVPVNKAYPLKALVDSLRDVLTKTRRKIFLEYVLLKGQNDSKKHAQDLIRFLHRVGRVDLLHVNLIVYNPTESAHEQSPVEQARQFRDWLRERGVRVTIRRNLGTDIQGACGQLVSDK